RTRRLGPSFLEHRISALDHIDVHVLYTDHRQEGQADDRRVCQRRMAAGRGVDAVDCRARHTDCTGYGHFQRDYSVYLTVSFPARMYAVSEYHCIHILDRKST